MSLTATNIRTFISLAMLIVCLALQLWSWGQFSKSEKLCTIIYKSDFKSDTWLSIAKATAIMSCVLNVATNVLNAINHMQILSVSPDAISEIVVSSYYAWIPIDIFMVGVIAYAFSLNRWWGNVQDDKFIIHRLFRKPNVYNMSQLQGEFKTRKRGQEERVQLILWNTSYGTREKLLTLSTERWCLAWISFPVTRSAS